MRHFYLKILPRSTQNNMLIYNLLRRDKKKVTIEDFEAIVDRLRNEYGELLTLEEVAKILRFKSVGAARKAYHRGTMPVKLYRFEGRSGYFAKVDEVAECLTSLTPSQPVNQ